MGTTITLDVGGLTVDGSKNSRGSDHGVLFQEKDRKRIRHEQLDYEYYEKHGLDPSPMEMAFSRPLRDIVPRIELLGFTLDQIRLEYAYRTEIWREENLDEDDDQAASEPDVMTFEEFCAFATAHPLQDLNDIYVNGFDAKAETKIRGRFTDPKINVNAD